jgi:hypothetical protein
MGRAEVERARAEAEARSIGPRSSSVVLGGQGPDIYFGVDWTEDVRRIVEAARHDETLDNWTRWGLIKQDDPILILDVGYDALGIELHLYFPLDMWRVELEMVRDMGGMMVLCRDGASAEEKLREGLGFRAEMSMLVGVLAAIERGVNA